MNCAYCTVDIEKGTGMMYVRKNGTVKYYCSNRCYKHNTVHNRKASRKEIADRSSS
ncbi:MAG: 50S ribosomal protein L24e [Candidatus Micrarchaeaceae archaeon]